LLGRSEVSCKFCWGKISEATSDNVVGHQKGHSIGERESLSLDDNARISLSIHWGSIFRSQHR